MKCVNRIRVSTRTILIFIVLLVLSIPTVSAAPKKIFIGDTERSVKGSVAKEWKEVLAFLNTSPHYSFELKTFPTADELNAALSSGKVDLALLGPVGYIKAHSESGAIPVVAEKGTTRTVIVTSIKSPFKSPRDLKGKSFGFGSRESTSSHLIPLLLLSKHHIKPQDLGAQKFLLKQDRIVEEVASGRVDAGALLETVFRRNSARLRQLDISDEYPGAPLVAQKNADSRFVNEVRAKMMQYRPSGLATTQRFYQGASPIADRDYNRVRFLYKILFGKVYR